MNFELIGVEHNLFGRLLELERDLDTALVGPISQELQVVDRQVVVDRLDAALKSLLASGSLDLSAYGWLLTYLAEYLDRMPFCGRENRSYKI